jgi:hypothetical protein
MAYNQKKSIIQGTQSHKDASMAKMYVPGQFSPGIVQGNVTTGDFKDKNKNKVDDRQEKKNLKYTGPIYGTVSEIENPNAPKGKQLMKKAIKGVIKKGADHLNKKISSSYDQSKFRVTPDSNKPSKKRSYADAKEADANLGSYISERKKHKKGSAEYNKVQNKINEAYGVSKRHGTTKASGSGTKETKPKDHHRYTARKQMAELRRRALEGDFGAGSTMEKYKGKNENSPREKSANPNDFYGKATGDKLSDAAFYGWAGGAGTKWAGGKLAKTKPGKAIVKTGGKVATKVGLKTGLKVGAKLGSRAIPVLGWGMAAWDVGKAVHYGIKGGSIKAGLQGLAKDYGISWSDARLKENITRTGASESGIPIYTFNYKDSNKLWSGTMAQDLLNLGRKDAVKMMDNGYYGVDYNKIDVDMVSRD